MAKHKKLKQKDDKKASKVKMGGKEHVLDDKVRETGDGGHLIFEQDKPDNTPSTPTFKMKGKTLIDGHHYSITGNVITWLRPISLVNVIEVYDGATKVAEWSAIAGDIAV